MYSERKNHFRELENARNSKVLLYVTGDRPGWETQVSSEAFDPFVDHLDKMGVVDRISLVLYTRGGDPLAGWSIVNLVKQFCSELEVIIPHKCHSTGTLIALGARKILMTKQATLGSIDPSVDTPLNPQIEGAPLESRVPVSVEGIQGFITLARKELGLKGEAGLAKILMNLSKQVHPLVLGQAIRIRELIPRLARRLIVDQVSNLDKIEELINFLTSESGSHDYTISRPEGRELGLNIESPNDTLYETIKSLYDDFRNELQLNVGFDQGAAVGQENTRSYEIKRALVESFAGGSHYFVSEGTFSRILVNTPEGQQPGTRDERTFEGWRRIACGV
ncbi:MAG: serine protease [Gammaproteobacteria bacterium]|nr:serine protease [Gammaproteobacteria bacterium]